MGSWTQLVLRGGHLTDMGAKAATATITRQDETQPHERPFEVALVGSQWPELPCLMGSLDTFSSPPSLAGGTREGMLLVKMPRAAKIRRQRVVEVRASSHKRTAGGDPGDTAVTDDVTRTVTLTFKRL